MLPAASKQPGASEIFRVFAKIGITSFGGGLVAYLRDALVTDKKWMDE